MKFTVVWTPQALNHLAQIWTSATDRAAVTAAANAIDRILDHDAANQGEARAGGNRILIEIPLAVYFRVSEADCLATVWAVWRWRGQP